MSTDREYDPTPDGVPYKDYHQYAGDLNRVLTEVDGIGLRLPWRSAWKDLVTLHLLREMEGWRDLTVPAVRAMAGMVEAGRVLPIEEDVLSALLTGIVDDLNLSAEYDWDDGAWPLGDDDLDPDTIHDGWAVDSDDEDGG